ncbi:hypothetical protein [Leptolyngbya sp. NIES-2104]|uniref:hypothetical protein n=1 Tax=Leptolyngbya sp. NIES-2104 TaxID=1552121 RepID=UPI0006ECB6A9|nr:hypothetical protein [Leptolyngbya sp. NIES-2104]GAP97543.1 hypothetical protein NIES2104_40900 [Leptolyngbya sp. NIES-2104]
MSTERVADMTIGELRRFVTQIVDEKLHDSPEDDRTLEEVLASMDRIRWTPPPGARTTLEMIQEDRNA